jgi:hypothetical protein
MNSIIEEQPSEQQRRLAIKMQDRRLLNELIEGAGMSRWEAQVAVDVVHEVYFTEPGRGPIRSGQTRYECVRADQGAGKALAQSLLTAVVLTVYAPEDLGVLQRDGASARRRHVIARICEEAREQGGLLTQEDLARLLFADVRTIRSDIKFFKEHGGVMIPTRGQQKDIGPTVTHKGAAIRLWITESKEPQKIAQHIQHDLKSVERYLGHFARVVYLMCRGFDTMQTAFTIGISVPLVKTYLELYVKYKGHPGFKNRLRELTSIGAAHYEMADQKKGLRMRRDRPATTVRNGRLP